MQAAQVMPCDGVRVVMDKVECGVDLGEQG